MGDWGSSGSLSDERIYYGGEEGEEDDGEVVSFSISASETGRVVVVRLNLRDGGLEVLVVEGGFSDGV